MNCSAMRRNRTYASIPVAIGGLKRGYGYFRGNGIYLDGKTIIYEVVEGSYTRVLEGWPIRTDPSVHDPSRRDIALLGHRVMGVTPGDVEDGEIYTGDYWFNIRDDGGHLVYVFRDDENRARHDDYWGPE